MEHAMEIMARELCHLRKLDPDKVVVYKDGDYCGKAPQWMVLRDEIRTHLEVSKVIKKIIGETL